MRRWWTLWCLPLLVGLSVGCGDSSSTLPGLVLISASPHGPPVVFATGSSQLTDSQAAGAEAARIARERLGGTPASVVLVFDRATDHEAMLHGVAGVFDRELIYGCSSYGPITQDSNEGTVGVMAVGGKINMAITSAGLDDGYRAGGEAIGRALDGIATDEGLGRVLLLFGKCHVPANDELTQGVKAVLGDSFPIVGGAASEGEWVYNQGRLIRDANIGVLLYGDFDCGFSTMGGRKRSSILQTAEQAIRDATGLGPERPGVVFTFNCGGRRGVLDRKGGVAQELSAMRQSLGSRPLFGFYGSGEIGPPQAGAEATGVEFHVAVCALRLDDQGHE